MSDGDVDYLTELFCRLLYEAYDSCCPIKIKRVKQNKVCKPWIDDHVKLCIQRKHALYRDYKRGIVEYDIFRAYSNRVANLLKSSKRRYFLMRFERSRGNMRETWSTINSAIGKSKVKNNQVPNITVDGDLITDKKQIASMFNNHFATIGSKLNDNIPRSVIRPLHYMGASNLQSMFATPCTADEVARLIRSLPSKSTGIDSIPTYILKRFVGIISDIIAKLFNKSLLTGSFPDCLKLASIIPLFKSGDRASLLNYRPISLLSTFSKIFEKLMHRRLVDFVEGFDLLSDNQYGFRSRHSTGDAILRYLSGAYASLDRGDYFCTVFLDFSKAFDTVNHDILLLKLHHMGIRGSVLGWFRSYLTNRSAYVSLGGVKSERVDLTMGVPQGSVLGPVLFNLYINDMSKSCGPLNCIHYADDTTLYLSHSSAVVLSSLISDSLKSLECWLQANRLSLNVNKTSYMVISNLCNDNFSPVFMGNVELNRVLSCKFLGLTIDSNLNFKLHVDNICKRIGRNIGIIYRIRSFVNSNVILCLYFSLIYPFLSYVVPAWGNSNSFNRDRISRLQRRVLRLLPDELYRAQLKFEYIYQYFTLVKFHQIRTLNLFPYFATVLNELRPNHMYETRFSINDNLNTPRHRLSKMKQSFLISGLSLWNVIPPQIRQLPNHHHFKRAIKTCLLSDQSLS